MKQAAYIIPGHMESHLTKRGYDKIAKLFEARAIEPIHVEINWKNKKSVSFTDYTEQFLKLYKKQKDTEVFILGFSFGAMIAFLVASKIKPKALILCSLSPYFEEDLKNLKPAWLKWWQKHSVGDDYSFIKLASSITSKTYLIVGEEEHKSCLIRTKDAKRKLLNSHLFVAKGAKHNVGQMEYLETIRKVISRL